jgi:hypothetical protein
VDVTFGTVADTAPEHFLPRRIHFSTLVVLDTPTKEGTLQRVIHSAGFGTRELPLAITGNAPGRGHEGAFPVGRLDQVRMSGTNVEGWGWLLNDENGRQVFHELSTGVVRGNSIEMTDVKFTVEVDWPEEDLLPMVTMDFLEANIGATTFVMKPAFKDASGEIEEEVTAALELEGDLEVTASFEVVIPSLVEPNLTAAGVIRPPHEAFEVPEPDGFQHLKVADNGWVSFHLGTWDTCHTGFIDRCVKIPRSRSNYANYCKRPLRTDKGTAYTGPLILLGGHDATRDAINAALDKVENVWADVVIRDGKFGPWACGVVRPGVTPEALYAASASSVSGHWLKGELLAVCSAPTEGFPVQRATSFVVELDEENEVEYLAASFAVDCGCEETLANGYNPVSPVKTEWPTVDERFAQVEYDQLLAAARAALEGDHADASEEGGLIDPQVPVSLP